MKRKTAIFAMVALVFGFMFWVVNSCEATQITFHSYLPDSPAVGVHVTISSFPPGPPPNLTPTPYNFNTRAGEFQVTLGTPYNFNTVSYCVEFGQYAGFQTYEYSLLSLTDPYIISSRQESYLKAAWLVQTYAPGLASTSMWWTQGGNAALGATIGEARAAVQMAVWETIYEVEDTSPRSLSDGNFQLTSPNSSATSLAAYLLGTIPNQVAAASVSNVKLAHNEGVPVGYGQDQMVVVPIPSALLLMGSGLLSLLGLRRRIVG